MARGSEEEEEFAEESDDEDFAAEEEDLEEEEAPPRAAAKGRKASSDAPRGKAKAAKGSAGKKRSRRGEDDRPRRKGSQYVQEEADEDDDEGEDGGGGGRKRPKGGSRFIDDIAAVDSDEEEEEADEEDDMLAPNDEDIGGEDIGAGSAAAHYRELDVLRQRQAGRPEQTEEELAKFLEEKYKEADFDEEDDYEAYGEEEDVGQQGLQPTKEDPGLFIVTCRLGCEREACMQLLQKAYNLAERGSPLQIKAAVCLDHLKGFFYVEAFRDSHVLEAVRGLRTIYAGKGARLVPLRERPAAISVNRQARAAIERDSWVRVRGGLYKDDLAKVVDVDFAAGRATVRLVPRLDLVAMAKDHMAGGRRNPFGRQAVRPPPRAFRGKEATELGLQVSKDRNDPSVATLNTHRFLGGHTLRSYTLKGLILQETAPPLEEIARFNAASGEEGGDDPNDPTAAVSKLLRSLPDGAAPAATYVKGDRVVVIRGDLASLQGVVEDVRDEGKLLVRPDLMADQTVELEASEVQKCFKPGDHVRVLAGPHAGESGLVVLLDGPSAVVLPDTRAGELRVFVRDLTEAQDSGTGVESLGGKYELHDLVQLDAHTAGVVVAIQRDTARVLTNQSTPGRPDVRLVREPDIVRKLLTNRASTTDCAGNTVSAGDYVALLDTPGAGGGAAGAGAPGGARKERGGTVHAISRGVLFVRVPELSDRGGFMVVRNRQVRLRGGAAAPASGGGAGGLGSGGPVPASVLASPQHAPGAGPQNPFADRGGAGAGFSGRPDGGAGAGFGGGGFGRGGGGGRGAVSALVGQELTVKAGPYARYKGRVKQETATHLQLELDAINRIVTVKKEDVFGRGGGAGGGGRGAFGGFVPGSGPGPGGLRPPGFGGFSPAGAAPPRTPAHVMQTPLHPSQGGQTPVHPSRTPLHPSMTPMHPSMTPMHPGTTPAHPSADADGDYYYRDRQPGAGRGSLAGPSGRGGMPAAAATPGGGGYGPPVATPGGILAGYAPAPTPGTAETPGGAYADPGNARTPGAMAATPGGPEPYGVPAYTPGGYAPAQTPGATDPIAPSPAGYGGEAYFAQPTPGGGLLGATPGTVATPGMVSGYTPAGVTPGVAYTPGLDGGGGIPSTPGFGAGLEPGGPGGLPGQQLPGQLGGPPPPGQQAPAGPDYTGVLVKLPAGGTGVAGAARPDGSVEAAPAGGGPAVALDLVELVEVDKKDWVKVVFGEKAGMVGQVIAFDGGDAVLANGDVHDRSMLGKLADQAAYAGGDGG